jgi:tetratricopeptide (TPR) repeat protein
MRIFLSYGHDNNEPIVLRIKADLEKPENGGHECWFDKSGIKAGDDWRRAITDGIKNSESILSFLSRHACREWQENGQRKQGVCLDELAIAVGHRSAKLNTILIESQNEPDKFNVPLFVNDTQHLDMHEWREKQDQGSLIFEAWYAENLAEITRIVNNPENAKFSGEIESLIEQLQPLDNAARICELMSNDFVGREWLKADVIDWLKNKPQERVFCLTGEPGFGKSAFAASLAYQNSPEVIAAHFCQYNQPNFSDPRRVICSIAFQIATRLPDFRSHLIETIRNLKMNKPNAIDEMEPVELFQILIADGAYKAIDGGRLRHLVIIDALDESGNALVELLAQCQSKIPQWLAFFVTSRPHDNGVRQHLTMLNPHYQDVADEHNQADAKNWITQWVDGLKASVTVKREVIKTLLNVSQGNFIYLQTFRKMVNEGQLILDQTESYPQGLDSLYFTFFGRQFKDMESYRKWQAPFLRLIIAARQPLPLNLARKVLALGKEDWRLKVVLPLGSLFKFSGDPSNESIEPFHKSIRDWLGNPTSSGDFYVDEDEGHLMLGTALWEELCSQGENLSDYGAIELPYHLLRLEKSALKNLIPNENIWEKYRDTCIGIRGKIHRSLKDKPRRLTTNAVEAWWRFILTIDESTFGDTNLKTAESLSALANVLNQTGRHSEAESFSRRALEIETKEDPNSLHTADCLVILARSLERSQLNNSRDADGQKRHIEAESYRRQVLKIQENLPQTWTRQYGQDLLSLANNLTRQKRYSEAKVYYLEALNINNKDYRSLWGLAMCLDSWYKESDVSWNNEDQQRHALVNDSSWTLEEHQHALNTEAEIYNRQLIKIYEGQVSRYPGSNSPLRQLRSTLYRLMENLYRQGRDEEAKICEDRAKEIRWPIER